jgi:hypothetical protein
MDQLFNLLKGFAPALATAAMGPAGGAIISMMANKLGVSDTVAEVTAALAADPEAGKKMRELDLEYAQMDKEDRDSARSREVEMAKSGASQFSQLVVPVLALGTVALTFVFIGILVFKKIESDQQQLVIFALGYATAAAQQVLSYYFGSSKSSQDKTAAMQKAFVK